MAKARVTRAREFNAWLNKCRGRRSTMYALVNSVIVLTTLTLFYANLVFAAKFDR